MHKRSSIFSNIAGLVSIVLMGFPVYWMLTTSFKKREDVLSTEPRILPESFTLDSYREAFSREGFYTSLRNSLIVVLITVLISLFLATFASVAIARMKFKGKRSFITTLLIVQMLPLSALIIPLFLLLTKLQVTNTIGGLAITYIPAGLHHYAEPGQTHLARLVGRIYNTYWHRLGTTHGSLYRYCDSCRHILLADSEEDCYRSYIRGS